MRFHFPDAHTVLFRRSPKLHMVKMVTFHSAQLLLHVHHVERVRDDRRSRVGHPSGNQRPEIAPMQLKRVPSTLSRLHCCDVHTSISVHSCVVRTSAHGSWDGLPTIYVAVQGKQSPCSPRHVAFRECRAPAALEQIVVLLRMPSRPYTRTGKAECKTLLSLI